jgi:hypothetical protein
MGEFPSQLARNQQNQSNKINPVGLPYGYLINQAP